VSETQSTTGELDKRTSGIPSRAPDWGAGNTTPGLVSGQGAMLRDSAGREYRDGNSSIWTNSTATGTRNRRRDHAQLDQVAHVSSSVHHPAGGTRRHNDLWPPARSPACSFPRRFHRIEVALKMAAQFWSDRPAPANALRASPGVPRRHHGASSLAIPHSTANFSAWQFPAQTVAPRIGWLPALDTEAIARSSLAV